MIDGVMFENMGIQSTHQTLYTNVANHAKNNQGFQTVAGNCKVAATVVETTWHSQTVPIDTFIVFDGEGLDPVDTSYSKYNSLNNNQLGVVAYGVPAQDTSWNSQMAQYIGYIYVTSGTGTSPYNSFPTYFQDFIANLNSIATGTGGGGGGGINDKFGVKKIYHTKIGGEEFFTNQTDVLADASSGGRIQNFEGENIVARSDGSHESDGGSNRDLRLEIWSPAYSDITQRTNACWLNAEVTTYSRYMSQDGSNPKCVCQLYAKGGHHTSSRPCEGAAYKFRWWRTGSTVSFDKEVCHSAYAGDFGRVNGVSQNFGNGDWFGCKAVQYNIQEGSNTYVKLELYADMNCSDANGNLTIRNDWKLLTSFIDRGTNVDAASPYSDCDGCGRESSRMVMTAPFYVTNSSSANYRRNLCAYRTDKVTTRFRYYSAREIDPTKPATGEDPTPPPPDGGGGGGGTPTTDQWGIAKIYPTITNGYEWYMNMSGTTPNTDTTKFRMNTAALTKNADGSFKYAASTPDMFVYQRNGYNATTTANNAPNHGAVASRGYMQDATDWRNIEATIYVRLNNATSASAFQWMARGGRHLEPPPNCEGSALRGYLYDNGQTLCAKEQWHASFATATRGTGTSPILGKWIGFKFVVVTKTVSGTVVTNQQIWLDPQNNNQWTKFDERTDNGGWGDQGGTCQGAPDQLITWGGPIVQFDWLNFNDVDFKNMSVREIDPNAVPAGSPPGGNTSMCGS